MDGPKLVIVFFIIMLGCISRANDGCCCSPSILYIDICYARDQVSHKKSSQINACDGFGECLFRIKQHWLNFNVTRKIRKNHDVVRVALKKKKKSHISIQRLRLRYIYTCVDASSRIVVSLYLGTSFYYTTNEYLLRWEYRKLKNRYLIILHNGAARFSLLVKSVGMIVFWHVFLYILYTKGVWGDAALSQDSQE